MTNESEPVLNEHTFTHKGLRCRIIEHRQGHYCGYVRTALSQHWNTDDFYQHPITIIDVHGGLTYGVDEDGWIGFDCAHLNDVCVNQEGEQWGNNNRTITDDTIVWTYSLIREETEELAAQISALFNFIEIVKRNECTND